MYIVKRPFKNFGRTMTVGSVITEPTKVKRFKGKLAEGKILFVPDKDLEKTKALFKEKYGVDISVPTATDNTLSKNTISKIAVAKDSAKSPVKKSVKVSPK